MLDACLVFVRACSSLFQHGPTASVSYRCFVHEGTKGHEEKKCVKERASTMNPSSCLPFSLVCLRVLSGSFSPDLLDASSTKGTKGHEEKKCVKERASTMNPFSCFPFSLVCLRVLSGSFRPSSLADRLESPSYTRCLSSSFMRTGFRILSWSHSTYCYPVSAGLKAAMSAIISPEGGGT